MKENLAKKIKNDSLHSSEDIPTFRLGKAMGYIEATKKAVMAIIALKYRIKHFPAPMSKGEWIAMKQIIRKYEREK